MSMTTNAWLFMAATMLIVGGFSASLYWAGAGRREGLLRGQGIALILTVPLAVGLLYAIRGEPAALNAPSAATHADENALPEAEQRLTERLQQQPNDTDGWLMLARTRGALGHYKEAAEAYEHAASRAMDDPEVLNAWIQARLLAADQHFDARTTELLARARAIAPDHPDVLSFSALEAIERGDGASATTDLRALSRHFEPDSPELKDIDTALEKLSRGEDPRGGQLGTEQH